MLANPTLEQESLVEDMKAEGIRIIWAMPFLGKNVLFYSVARTLLKGEYDLINSQGFITAFHVAMVSWIFRIPHVFTIQSILVEKFFQGKLGWLKKILFSVSMRTVTVYHGVSNDMIEYTKERFPGLLKSKSRWMTIESGVLSESFAREYPDAREDLRRIVDIGSEKFIFGFFGRLDPEKGFASIIDAVEQLGNKGSEVPDFIVIAVEHGNLTRDYLARIAQEGLDRFFRFIPFNPVLAPIMKGCDSILMPSLVEGRGLVACEVLCTGVPLIATDCLALRETVADTPTLVINRHDPNALSEAMIYAMNHPGLKERFRAFQKEAVARFDIRESSDRLRRLFDELIEKN